MDPPHTSLVPQAIPTIFSSGIPNPPQKIAGLRLRRCSWRVCAAITCHNNTHNCDVLLLSFPKRKLRRQVCTNCVIHETYVSQRLTNQSVTHPSAVGLRSRCRPLTSISCNYAPSLPPFMLPFRIMFDIYIIKLRMWRDGSLRFVWVGGSLWVLADPRFIQFALGS